MPPNKIVCLQQLRKQNTVSFKYHFSEFFFTSFFFFLLFFEQVSVRTRNNSEDVKVMSIEDLLAFFKQQTEAYHWDRSCTRLSYNQFLFVGMLHNSSNNIASIYTEWSLPFSIHLVTSATLDKFLGFLESDQAGQLFCISMIMFNQIVMYA